VYVVEARSDLLATDVDSGGRKVILVRTKCLETRGSARATADRWSDFTAVKRIGFWLQYW